MTTGNVLAIGRRLRTPGAAEWTDGAPVDAGTAMILRSNISHLQAESLRHLVTALGPGALEQKLDYGDARDRTFDTTPGVSEIAWAPSLSRCFGPLDIVCDRELGGGQLALRVVRVKLRVVANTGSSLRIFSALTPHGQMPENGTGGTMASATIAVPSGTSTQTMDLATDQPFTATQQRPCRGGNLTPQRALYGNLTLWVGWRSLSVNDRVLSINAFEARL